MSHPKDLGQINDYLDSAALASDDDQLSAYGYVAVKLNGTFALIGGRVIFNVVMPTPAPFSFFSDTVIAESFLVRGTEKSPREILESLIEGKIFSTKEDVRFVPRDQNSFGISHYALGPPPQGQVRLNSLKIFGADLAEKVNYPEIAWDLRSHETPYDGLPEIFDACGVLHPSGPQSVFEVVAQVLTAIDTGRSVVNGGIATIGVNALHGVDLAEVSLGLKIAVPKGDVERRQVQADQMNWLTTDTKQEGTVEISVPTGAVVECIACYRGRALHYYWIADPSETANGRKVSVETFDAGLSRFQESLKWENARGRNSRDFESGFCSMLWMLGVSPLHFDRGGKTQEAVDILSVAGADQMMLIECTVGILKAEGKLANLIARTERLRRQFRDKGRNVELLPVIVSPMSRQELASELAAAGAHGVAVVAQEQLAELQARIDRPIDANAVFKEIKSYVPADPNAVAIDIN
ncbi:MAG: hypothetical protein GC155_10780 [Alphaproteobacteria bacterium]|nr:hypothetical protein [Alphaproteobacteria bacterium]